MRYDIVTWTEIRHDGGYCLLSVVVCCLSLCCLLLPVMWCLLCVVSLLSVASWFSAVSCCLLSAVCRVFIVCCCLLSTVVCYRLRSVVCYCRLSGVCLFTSEIATVRSRFGHLSNIWSPTDMTFEVPAAAPHAKNWPSQFIPTFDLNKRKDAKNRVCGSQP